MSDVIGIVAAVVLPVGTLALLGLFALAVFGRDEWFR